MTDHATPNLPSIDFEITSKFYQSIGFLEGFRDDGWMILRRGQLSLEFFPYHDLNPAESSFSCCLRLDDMAAFHAECRSAKLSDSCWGWPRLSEPQVEDSGLTIAYLVDPNGTLLRLIQN